MAIQCFRWNGEPVSLEWMQKHYNVHIVPAPAGPAWRVAILREEFNIDIEAFAPGALIRAILPGNEQVYESPLKLNMNVTWSYAPFGDGRTMAQGGPLGVKVEGAPSDYVDRLGIAYGQDGGLGSAFYPPPHIQGNYGHINVTFAWDGGSVPGTGGGAAIDENALFERLWSRFVERLHG